MRRERDDPAVDLEERDPMILIEREDTCQVAEVVASQRPDAKYICVIV